MKSSVRFQQLNELVNEYVLIHRGLGIAGLPAKPKRDQLEELAWRILNEAIGFKESEEAAQNARARLRVMQVVSNLMRVHLAILHEQDAAAVDELIDELKKGQQELQDEVKRLQESAQH
jgi:hypothetical protein